MLFEDYQIESAHLNEIYMDVTIDLVIRALRSAQTAYDCHMKLTKKLDMPYLSLTSYNQVKKNPPFPLPLSYIYLDASIYS
jgi:hypothetical protein